MRVKLDKDDKEVFFQAFKETCPMVLECLVEGFNEDPLQQAIVRAEIYNSLRRIKSKSEENIAKKESLFCFHKTIMISSFPDTICNFLFPINNLNPHLKFQIQIICLTLIFFYGRIFILLIDIGFFFI